jgi:electron transport complex protein RnfC
MKLFTFGGGVHPPYRKELAKDRPVQKAAVPQQLIVPLVQHIGAPTEPVVAQGDTVKEGQVIGKPKGFVSAPIHAPAAGKIKKIEKSLHPLGQYILSVFIEPGEDGEKDYMEPLGGKATDVDPKDMLTRIVDAGIVGMGGATFPTHVKFSPPMDKPIDTFIVNGCECEPYLTADQRLMFERADDLLVGAEMIGRILGVERIIIAVENNKPEAKQRLEKGLEEAAKNSRIECLVTHTKYPQGAEKMLIKAVLGKEVPSGGLPMDVGVVVSNVGTAVAVCEAVRDGKPLIERVVTVTGDGVKKPGNFLVKIGTTIKDLLEQAEGTAGNIGKCIMGGPMMGLAQPSLEVPVIKGTSGIVLLREAEYMKRGHYPCIRCSFCVQSCPVSLMPSTLSVIAEAKKWELAEKYGVNDCIECGCCTYVCPANRPIVQWIKTGKVKLREIKAREKT